MGCCAYMLSAVAAVVTLEMRIISRVGRLRPEPTWSFVGTYQRREKLISTVSGTYLPGNVELEAGYVKRSRFIMGSRLILTRVDKSVRKGVSDERQSATLFISHHSSYWLTGRGRSGLAGQLGAWPLRNTLRARCLFSFGSAHCPNRNTATSYLDYYGYCQHRLLLYHCEDGHR